MCKSWQIRYNGVMIIDLEAVGLAVNLALHNSTAVPGTTVARTQEWQGMAVT